MIWLLPSSKPPQPLSFVVIRPSSRTVRMPTVWPAGKPAPCAQTLAHSCGDAEMTHVSKPAAFSVRTRSRCCA